MKQYISLFILILILFSGCLSGISISNEAKAEALVNSTPEGKITNALINALAKVNNCTADEFALVKAVLGEEASALPEDSGTVAQLIEASKTCNVTIHKNISNIEKIYTYEYTMTVDPNCSYATLKDLALVYKLVIQVDLETNTATIIEGEMDEETKEDAKAYADLLPLLGNCVSPILLTLGFFDGFGGEAQPAEPPSLFISSDVTEGEEPLTVSFIVICTDPSGSMSECVLDFGDGTLPNTLQFPAQEEIEHIYESAGVYNVILTAKDALGQEYIETETINVTESSVIAGEVTLTHAKRFDMHTGVITPNTGPIEGADFVWGQNYTQGSAGIIVGYAMMIDPMDFGSTSLSRITKIDKDFDSVTLNDCTALSTYEAQIELYDGITYCLTLDTDNDMAFGDEIAKVKVLSHVPRTDYPERAENATLQYEVFAG